MRVKRKDTGYEATATKPNFHGVGEMIVLFDDGSMDSDYVRDWTAVEGGDEALLAYLQSKEP
jgi:hypothetical protein